MIITTVVEVRVRIGTPLEEGEEVVLAAAEQAEEQEEEERAGSAE